MATRASTLAAGSPGAIGSYTGCAITVYLGATNGTDYVASREGFWLSVRSQSGGHYTYTASTIEGGLVIDLVRLNGITLSEDKGSAIVEPGNTWAYTYENLQKSGVTIPDGRMFGIEFEVVMASGEIVNASTTPNPDLYWALRGGGSNFGVVTKFKFNTFPQDKMWYAKLHHDAAENITANAAFADWSTIQSPKYLSNAAVLFWNAQASGAPVGVAISVHQKTFDNNTHPPVVDKFYDSKPSAIEAINVFHSQLLGFVNLRARWENAKDDDAIYRAQLRTEERISKVADEMGLASGYKYMNYASQFQDLFDGYGQANKERLRSIAEKYDPSGVFQELSPGGFKVTKGAPQIL
ncbi:FAD binding domain-containing protein [Colletotrichum tamarilloi]|uniref:FAD binding domain-containing protein n=1 Tax=Colletotrichum tamarilloi TaxID=1209934 RepID=A0ABQ9RBE0_9PEZI|nr:FAD binding domain-containing protein [Colletotrichum tamarilloi]KAK1500528.1 FAD binding domain-containing protein [Colletotrichum tamarilloi]